MVQKFQASKQNSSHPLKVRTDASSLETEKPTLCFPEVQGTSPSSLIQNPIPKPPANSLDSQTSFASAFLHFQEENSKNLMGIQEDLDKIPLQKNNFPFKFKIQGYPYYP